MNGEFQAYVDRKAATRILDAYMADWRRRREAAADALRLLARTDPARARLAYMAQPAIHDDDGSG